MPLAERLIEHPARDLRVPVVEGGEQRVEDPSDDHVVEMSDHEVRETELPIERRHRLDDAGEASDEELEEEGDREQHRGPELDAPAPHGREPVEDLDTRGNADRHGGDGEEAVR